MKNILAVTILLFLFVSNSQAQRWKRVRYEVIGGINTMTAMTDLGGGAGVGTFGFKDMDISATRPALFVGARYKVYERLAARLHIGFGWIAGSDSYTTEPSRNNRGVSFSGPLMEISAQGEYSILKERLGTRYTFSNIRRFKLKYVNTYIFAGLGMVAFWPNNTNPTVKSNSEDGKNGTYSHVAAAFPLGIGFKYGINRKVSLSLEFGGRFTTTDYLDGHKDTYSTSNDGYLTMQIGLNYKLRTARSGLPRF